MGWRSNEQVNVIVHLCLPVFPFPKLIHVSHFSLLHLALFGGVGVAYCWIRSTFNLRKKSRLPGVPVHLFTWPQRWSSKESEGALLVNSFLLTPLNTCSCAVFSTKCRAYLLVPFMKVPGLKDRTKVRVHHVSWLTHWLSRNFKCICISVKGNDHHKDPKVNKYFLSKFSISF